MRMTSAATPSLTRKSTAARTSSLFRVLCHHPHSERQSGFDHTADPGDSPIKASTHTCDPLVLGAIGAIERRRNIDTALREDLDDPGLADREVRIYLDELVTYMAGVTHVLLQSRMSHRLPAYKLNIVAAQNVRLVDQGLPIDSGVTTLWRRVGVTMSTPQVAVLREFEPEELEPLDRGRKTRRVFIGQTTQRPCGYPRVRTPRIKTATDRTSVAPQAPLRTAGRYYDRGAMWENPRSVRPSHVVRVVQSRFRRLLSA